MWKRLKIAFIASVFNLGGFPFNCILQDLLRITSQVTAVQKETPYRIVDIYASERQSITCTYAKTSDTNLAILSQAYS